MTTWIIHNLYWIVPVWGLLILIIFLFFKGVGNANQFYDNQELEWLQKYVHNENGE